MEALLDAPFQGLGLDTPPHDLGALRRMVVLADASRVVEVGSWTGRTALNFLGCRPELLIWCVDTWAGTPGDTTGALARHQGPEKVWKTFCENLGALLFRRAFPCRGTSLSWAEVWPFQADLVFIDADHSAESVRQDIKSWRQHVRPGGILCGHDYGYFPGVTQAVDEIGKDGIDGTVWWKRL